MNNASSGPLLGLPEQEPPLQEEPDPPQRDTTPAPTNVDHLLIDTLLQDFPDVLTEKPGRTHIVKHRINTGDSQPLRGPVYRLSDDRRRSLRKQLGEMLADGRIVPSFSPWASPVVMVPKKSKGDYRLCIDYRKLNRVTKLDAYPMPTIDYILHSLHGATIFSSLDLKSGYHQMMMHDDDMEKTAFKCEEGLFQFTVLPFGVVNGPASFQRLMEIVLHGLIGKICYVYLDDIVCYSSTPQQHLADLRQILQRLQRSCLTVNIQKCVFGCSSMKYLGHIVGNNGLRTDPEKVQGIFDYPIPTNVKQLERFLGMVTWYGKFIPHLASIAAPLNQLRHKTAKWEWTDECTASFSQMKSILASEPVLVYPDLSRSFVIHTDASNTGLGAVLLQEIDGELHTIAYASRSLDVCEQNYSTTERECLAVIWALEKWRVYLEGKRFQVVTDHQALTWLFKKARLTGKFARWVLRLQDFCFDVTYRPGALHVVPDALSRAHDSPIVGNVQSFQTPAPANSTPNDNSTIDDDSTDENCAAPLCENPQTNPIDWIQCDGCDRWYHLLCVRLKQKVAQQIPSYSCPRCKKKRWDTRREMEWQTTEGNPPDETNTPLPDIVQLKMEQACDPSLVVLITDTDDSHVYRLRDNVLYHYHKSKWKLVVPKTLQQVVLQACHSKPTAGHLGRTKTLQRLDSLHLWWKGISADVRSFVRACKICRQTKPVFRKPPGLMLSTNSESPWEIVGVDLMGPLPKSYGGNEYLLVAVDHYSKWVEVFPLRKATGKAVACLIVRQLFSRYGAPKRLLSDNGSQFTCKAMEAVCAEWGVEQIFISPYHPQSNGWKE